MLLETKPEVESSRLAPFYSLPAAVAKVVIVALALLIPLDATECLAQAGAQATPQVKPVGVVTQITTGSMTLHTDGGQDVAVQLPDGVSVLRVPPGAKDLKSAAKMSVSDINAGDRVLVRGKLSDDQKSMLASTVIIMTRADIAKAHDAERLEWQRNSVGGLVKSVDPAAKELTISVPNTPPTAGNPTHPLTIALAPNASILRYAPGSVRFSDAKPGTFDQIMAGDQIRALGTMSEDHTRYMATKLVSGSFRNIAATVISVDSPNSSVTVKNLANGKPVVVKTNSDTRMHTLPPFVAMMIAMLNSGQGSGAGAGFGAGAGTGQAGAGGSAAGGAGGATRGAMGGRFGAGGPGGPGGGLRDFNQMLDRTPALSLSDLKPNDAVIVVSTEGENPSEVTAIVLLSGVEPILAARPKGSNEVNLGTWAMGGGGGEEGGP